MLLQLAVFTVCSLSIYQNVELYGMDQVWPSGDPVFNLQHGHFVYSTDKSSCIPLLEPQFAHLLNGVYSPPSKWLKWGLPGAQRGLGR